MKLVHITRCLLDSVKFRLSGSLVIGVFTRSAVYSITQR
ncbi:hypothetical protein BH09BAC4_BH09BAC4_14130 [soil metagenome]